MKRFWNALTGRGAATVALIAGAALSVALACAGATGALAWMTRGLSIAALGVCAAWCALAAARSRRKIAALCLHLGFALVLGGWVYNACRGPNDGYLRLRAGQTGRVAESETADGFLLSVRDFAIDRWPDTGTVRQYTCRAEIEPDGAPRRDVTISVNHPLVACGWWVYQSSYEELVNPHTGRPLSFTILQCVKDVGLPAVALGGFLLLLGALLFVFTPHPAPNPPHQALSTKHQALSTKHQALSTKHQALSTKHQALSTKHQALSTKHQALSTKHQALSTKHQALSTKHQALSTKHQALSTKHQALSTKHQALSTSYGLLFLGTVAMLVHRAWTTGHPPMQNLYEFLMCAAALLPVLTFFARKERHALLVDAALLTLVLVPVCFVMDGAPRRLMPALQSPFFVPHVGAYVLGYILLVRAALGTGRRLVPLGFFLLTLGLVLGAAWGKVCWGHWWQFDPKEMWSLATWFVYAAYFHRRPRLSPRAENVFLAAGAVMILLTLTWINLSRLFTGMHSYA